VLARIIRSLVDARAIMLSLIISKEERTRRRNNRHGLILAWTIVEAITSDHVSLRDGQAWAVATTRERNI